MNADSAADRSSIETVLLPSGTPIKVEVAGSPGGDGMGSVGLRDLDLSHALDTVGELGSMAIEKVKAAKPTQIRGGVHFSTSLRK